MSEKFLNCGNMSPITVDSDIEDTTDTLLSYPGHATKSKGRNSKHPTTKKKTIKSPDFSMSEDIIEVTPNKPSRRKKVKKNLDSDYIPDLSLKIPNQNIRPKRANKRNRNTANFTLETLLSSVFSPGVCPRASKRGRKSNSINASNGLDISNNSQPVINARGGRGGRRGRGRNVTVSRNQNRASRNQIAATDQGTSSRGICSDIINIGNTAEYSDLCDDIAIFSKQTSTNNDVINLDAIEDEEDNEPLSVKVIWKTVEIHKFAIRRHQKVKQIFDSFSKKENVSPDKLLFMYKNKILKCDDSPDSIGYDIAEFIDGGIVSKSINGLVNEKKESNSVTGIKIKFQCQNSKKPMSFNIEKNDKLSLVMIKCAEALELPLNKLKFEFDGEKIAGTSTPELIGMETGDCIDVTILS